MTSSRSQSHQPDQLAAQIKIQKKCTQRKLKRKEKRKSDGRRQERREKANPESVTTVSTIADQEDYGIWGAPDQPCTKQEKRALRKKRQRRLKYGLCPYHDRHHLDQYPKAYRQWADKQMKNALEAFKRGNGNVAFTTGDPPCTCRRRS
jgi:hypothetical protein